MNTVTLETGEPFGSAGGMSSETVWRYMPFSQRIGPASDPGWSAGVKVMPPILYARTESQGWPSLVKGARLRSWSRRSS